MILLIVALNIEAKPLIDKFNLKRDQSFLSHEVFYGDNLRLIISGVGKLNASIATTLLLAKYSQSKLTKKPIILNIGFSAKKESKLGEVFIVNKISDLEEDFYPEMNIKFSLNEASLNSLNQPMRDSSLMKDNILYDMEASAIFISASKFIPTSSVYFLKIVSDSGSDSFLSKKLAKELFEPNLELIDSVIKKLIKHSRSFLGLSINELAEYKTILTDSSLSKTQIDSLTEPLLAYLLSNGSFENFKKELKELAKLNKLDTKKELSTFIGSLNV